MADRPERRDRDLRARLERAADLITRIAGGEYHARGIITPELDELDGVVAGLNLLAEDLGAERAAREAAEEQLRDALASYDDAPAWFCSVDTASGLIVQCNQSLVHALGTTRAELLGLPLKSIYTEASWSRGEASIAAILAGAHPPTADHTLKCRDGKSLVALLSGGLILDDSGQATRLRLVYRDVTEERALEAQLIHAQKMDGIGRLAGGVAHDFNNLLTAIVGSVEMMRPDVPRSALEDLDQISAAADRAAELTRQLLGFSRRTVMRPVPLAVVPLIANVERLLRRTLGEAIEIDTVLAADAWSTVADPVHLEQAIMNLALNARDAMPGGGRLTIEVKNAAVRDASARVPHGDYVVIHVVDTGTGMSPEVLAHVFEPFFTTKEVGKGTGLGLAMVYGIVDQAGGHTTVESEVERGSRFSIWLPRSAAAPAAPAPVKATPAPGGHETVLVVEDDGLVRVLTSRVLRSGGYEVLEASDGELALALLRQRGQPVDLMVSDVVMPRIGGRELVEAARLEGLVRRVLLVSGYSNDASLLRNVGLPADYLQKPFAPAALLGRVRALLDAEVR